MPESTDVLFLGSDGAAARCLEELAEAGHSLRVVTPPDRRRGRRGTPTPTPVRGAAERLGAPLLTAADVNDPAVVAALRDPRPRLLVVVAFGQILRKPVREIPVLGCLNLHFSLLPRWRGAAPVQHAILAGDVATGVCVQRLVARLDEGDVLATERCAIAPREDAPALRARLVALGAPLLRDVVGQLLTGECLPELPQDESAATYAPKLDSDAGRLDFESATARELDRRVRALIEWPGAHAVLRSADGREVAVSVHAATPEEGGGVATTVVSADASGLVVAAREGLLRITELQRAGKRVLCAGEFLNGCPVAPGDLLLAR